jgi:hypothetical protein
MHIFGFQDENGVLVAGKQGEFLANVEEGCVFVEANHAGDPDLQYLCVQAHRAALYHCGKRVFVHVYCMLTTFIIMAKSFSSLIDLLTKIFF